MDETAASPLTIGLGGKAKIGRHIIAVDQNVAGRRGERAERPAHGQETCLTDVDAIDFRRVRKGDRDGDRREQYVFVKAVSLFGGQLL